NVTLIAPSNGTECHRSHFPAPTRWPPTTFSSPASTHKRGVSSKPGAVQMIAVYAGRFDPVTNGHLDILRRAARIFEHVVVAVFDAPSDKTLFPTSQRVS